MCYCRSAELYDELNEKNEYLIKDEKTNLFRFIYGKRDLSKVFSVHNSLNYKNFKNAVESYLISVPHNIDKIDFIEIEGNPLEFYRKYISKGIPCIIKNIAKDWPALVKWQNNNYLIEKMSLEKLTVDTTPDGFADSIKSKYFVQPYQSKMTFEEFLEKIKKPDGKIHYIQKQNNNLNEEFSHFLKDISSNVKDLFEQIFLKSPDASNIWIGTNNSVTSMHKDNYENIFTVIKGEKHFTLIPPIYYPFLKPSYYKDARWNLHEDKFWIEVNSIDTDIPWISMNPDIENHCQELGIELKKFHVVIESGDGLYLPPLWYHQVSQFSFNNDIIIGVNYWFDMEYNSNYVLYDLIRDMVNLSL